MNVSEMLCSRCGHPASWHRHDDADNMPVGPACRFRCIDYDCEVGGRPPLGGQVCDCPDMVR